MRGDSKIPSALPSSSDNRGEANPARRRTLIVLALATAIGSAGLAAGGTAGALLGAEIAGTAAAAGLPLGVLVVGQAVAALLGPEYSSNDSTR